MSAFSEKQNQPISFSKDEGVTKFSMRDFLLSFEQFEIDQDTLASIIEYFNKMQDFRDDPPLEVFSKESKNNGALMRPFLDDQPFIRNKVSVKGHMKKGVAHGIGVAQF